jgi:hypothetical protein
MTSRPPSPDAGADPQGWRTELTRALAQPALAEFFADPAREPPDEPARRAAYWLAVVLGSCRLRGVDLGEQDGALPPLIALAAGRQLGRHLGRWLDSARHLEGRLAEADGVAESNDLCFDLLEARMEGWAAFVAIDEAYQACLEERSPHAAEFGAVIDQVLDQTEGLDRELLAQLELLSLVAHYPLLDNWKAALADPYAEFPPWWLDGRLQETAKRVAEDALTWLPRRPLASPRPPPTSKAPARNGGVPRGEWTYRAKAAKADWAATDDSLTSGFLCRTAYTNAHQLDVSFVSSSPVV